MSPADEIIPDDSTARPFAELVDSGLLWYLNSTAFWPRGFALGLIVNPEGVAVGWDLTNFGDAVLSSSEEAANRRFTAVEAEFAKAARR